MNLEGVDAAVLSHGHYDHCLGLCRLVEAGGLKAPLYVHRDFFTDRWWDKGDSDGYYYPTSSGLDAPYLLRHGVLLRALAQPVFQPFPGEELYLLSGFRRACRFEPMDPADLVFTGSGFRVDDYRDELALVVRGETGLAIFTGCAHSGLVNICTHAEALLGLPVLAYVGGTHLAPSPLTRAERTAEYVNASSIRTLAACHCTGPSAMELFARAWSGLHALFHRGPAHPHSIAQVSLSKKSRPEPGGLHPPRPKEGCRSPGSPLLRCKWISRW